MALKKAKQLPNGVVGDYWKIIKVEIDRPTLTLRVAIDLFLSEAQKNGASLNAPKSKAFKCSREELQGDLIALGYNKVKAHANSDLPNLIGTGTHKGDLDLIGAIDV